MSLESHIESLSERLTELDGQIHEAYVHHQPTNDLKRKRLHLMDAIRQLLSEYNKKQAA